MKKLLSIALALVLILSMSIVASAEEVKYAATESTQFTIKKTYDCKQNLVPEETLNFDIKANENNPDKGVAKISIGESDSFKVDSTDNKIFVTVPSLSVAGEYNWTIQEEAGKTVGVTYDTGKTIYVTALVVYDNNANALKIQNVSSFIKKIDGVKSDELGNKFQTNNFTVAKHVDGNMADKNDTFKVKVTLSVPSGKEILTPITVGGETVAVDKWTKGTYETTLTLSEADGTVTFADIPYGVNVSVAELTADEAGNSLLNGYEQKGYKLNGENAGTVSFTIGDTANSVVVENYKNAQVDTGITMDSMPYVLLLAVACFGMAVLFSKKRMMREN